MEEGPRTEAPPAEPPAAPPADRGDRAAGSCAGRLWILVGPASPLPPEAAATLATQALQAVRPGPAPALPGAAAAVPLHDIRTVEVDLPAGAPPDLAALDRGLAAALPRHPDLAAAFVEVLPDARAVADGGPAVAVGPFTLADPGPGEALVRRWRLGGADAGAIEETLRRLHRFAVAEFLLARHAIEARGYSGEIEKELAFIDRSIHKILRFRIEGQDRPGIVAQLEQNVKEMSANYAKLNRNAGIFREVVAEQERQARLLRGAVEELGPAALPGRSESVFSRCLDRAPMLLNHISIPGIFKRLAGGIPGPASKFRLSSLGLCRRRLWLRSARR
jgi:hypothetical protein